MAGLLSFPSPFLDQNCFVFHYTVDAPTERRFPRPLSILRRRFVDRCLRCLRESSDKSPSWSPSFLSPPSLFQFSFRRAYPISVISASSQPLAIFLMSVIFRVVSVFVSFVPSFSAILSFVSHHCLHCHLQRQIAMFLPSLPGSVIAERVV